MVEPATPAGTAKGEIASLDIGRACNSLSTARRRLASSGDYPTPGGVKRVNQAFIDYVEQVYQF